MHIKLAVDMSQVRALLGDESQEAQAAADLSQRALTVLQEAEAACSPVQALPSSGASSLESSPERHAGSPTADPLPLPSWRSHGLKALIRSLQSEFQAAERALLTALEQQGAGTGEEGTEWSIGAMREASHDGKHETNFGSSQALAKLSQCLMDTCNAADDSEA